MASVGKERSAIVRFEDWLRPDLDIVIEWSPFQLNPKITRLERFAFYERVEKAHAVVATGDVNKYANIILKKGVTPQ